MSEKHMSNSRTCATQQHLWCPMMILQEHREVGCLTEVTRRDLETQQYSPSKTTPVERVQALVEAGLGGKWGFSPIGAAFTKNHGARWWRSHCGRYLFDILVPKKTALRSAQAGSVALMQSYRSQLAPTPSERVKRSDASLANRFKKSS